MWCISGWKSAACVCPFCPFTSAGGMYMVLSFSVLHVCITGQTSHYFVCVCVKVRVMQKAAHSSTLLKRGLGSSSELEG